MVNPGELDRTLGRIGVGVILVWWGLRWWPMSSLPNGTGLMGTGLILLAVNAARSISGIPLRSLTTRLGLLALAAGAAVFVASEVLHLSLEIPLFEGSLIAIGGFLIVRAVRSGMRTSHA